MLKSYITGIIEKLSNNNINLKEKLLDNDSVLSYGFSINSNSGEIVKGGGVKKELLAKWGIKGDVFFADFNWKFLLQLMPGSIEFKEINRFPTVTRDLALIIDKNVHFSTLKEIALKSEKELLKEISVFDVYEGKGMEINKKSYALRFILQSESNTLNDKEIDKVMEKLTRAFTEKAGAIVRTQ
jgi:phenylalanyl-tRNA synthetase beta chain